MRLRKRVRTSFSIQVLRDLKWLGLEWDEGPDNGGSNGPYRQSERAAAGVYSSLVDRLLVENKAYRCFCTDDELKAMREEQERRKEPPMYRGKWSSATDAEVSEAMGSGLPYSVRLRVPRPDRKVTLPDLVRGDVTWDTNTLSDFVIMRSNGLPVYNFCCAIDDAAMGITHVLRAEEHLPNTLKQLLVYEALEIPHDTWPRFGHVSLILAPDKSKLSKRHGATSIGEFASLGYLPSAMANYLCLLGWNDGTEQELYGVYDELRDAFSIDRITKSAAVFDRAKLTWMNGQKLRSLDADAVSALIGEQLVAAGVTSDRDSPLSRLAAQILVVDLPSDAEAEVRHILSYPLAETLASSAAAATVAEPSFWEIARELDTSFANGELMAAALEEGGGFKAFIKKIGERTGTKGKKLFMPVRIALTGSMKGPEVGDVVRMVTCAEEESLHLDDMVGIDARMAQLREARMHHVKETVDV